MEGVVSNPISFPSQGQLLRTQTEIQMWGMKFLGTEDKSTHQFFRFPVQATGSVLSLTAQ